MSMKSYRAKGGRLPVVHSVIDKRAFPFAEETVKNITIRDCYYDQIPTRSNLPAANVANARLEFNVDSTSDGSMWDLKNSYLLFKINNPVPNDGAAPPVYENLQYGLSQFASNQLIKDCQIIIGTTHLEDDHKNMYTQSAFVKDLLYLPRPAMPSKVAGQDENCQSLDVEEEVLLEGNYLSHPYGTLATANGTPIGALEFTKQYLEGIARVAPAGGGAIPTTSNQFYLKVSIKDTIFMSDKFFPSFNPLKLILTVTLNDILQQEATAVTNMQMLSATLFLKRIFVSDSSSSAISKALASSPLTYVVPHSRMLQYSIPTGITSFNIPQLFSDNYCPDLICVFAPLSANDNSMPLTACGNGGVAPPNAIIGTCPSTGAWITSMWVQVGSKKYPPVESSGNTFISSGNYTAYREYVENCLNEQYPYLDWLHWCNHYTIYCINIRNDRGKFYNQEPSPNPQDINLHFDFSGGGGFTVYACAFNNVKVKIHADGSIDKEGF